MSEEQQETPQYHVVILQHNGDFITESFVTLPELTQRLRELIDRDVSVSCFKGDRLKISKPPFRYLMTADSNVPLWEAPDNIEEDETGYMGVDPAYLEGPPQIHTPAQPSAAQPDEFFTDDTSQVRNVFDDLLPDPDD